MNAIDIRTQETAPRVITFGDGAAGTYRTAHTIEKGATPNFCYIHEKSGDTVRVAYADIPNLILALEKAQELGWDN